MSLGVWEDAGVPGGNLLYWRNIKAPHRKAPAWAQTAAPTRHPCTRVTRASSRSLLRSSDVTESYTTAT